MMDVTQCRDLISKTSSIVGKKVRYENEIYTVRKIFPAPSDGLVKVFLVDYYLYNRNEGLALDKFLTSRQLDVYVMCTKDSDTDQQEVLLKLGSVELPPY